MSTQKHMNSKFFSIVAVFLLTLAAPHAAAQTPGLGPLGDLGLGDSPIFLKDSRVVLSHSQVKPGESLTAALELNFKKEWTWYSPDPGSSARYTPMAGGVNVDAGDLTAGPPRWPMDAPHETPLGDISVTTNAYEGRVIVYIPLTVPAGLRPGSYIIGIAPTGQACGPVKGQSQCLDMQQPTKFVVTATVTVGPRSEPNPDWEEDGFAAGLPNAVSVDELKARHAKLAATAGQAGAGSVGGTGGLTIWSGLGLALLAGLILNIMPCVLPVIPLKVLSIVAMAKESRRRFILLGLAFIAGILLFFAGLAVVNLVLQLGFHQALNWGEHFKSTSFRIAMSMVVVAVGANLLGAFAVNVPTKIANLGAKERGESYLSAVGSGLLTAVLSTPCSFAFLTSAFAWAQVQPLWLGTAAIMAIGLGMAAPYALLTAFPKLMARLPKPGRWMELFKQSLGFVMLLVAVWLVSTLAGDSYPAWVTAYGVVLAFCLWAWTTWVRYDASVLRKITVRGVLVAVAVSAGVWMLTPHRLAVDFQPFGEAKIAAANKDGRIVLVDFPANWCGTCKTVEWLVYDDPEVARELADRNVLAMKGDVTTADLPANKLLYGKLKEPGIPVTAIFPPDGRPPIRLYGIFSKADLFKALDEASSKRQ